MAEDLEDRKERSYGIQSRAFYAHSTERNAYGNPYLDKPWSTILKEEHIYRQHRTDDFLNTAKERIEETWDIFAKGNYVAIFGWLEFVLKHPRVNGVVPSPLQGFGQPSRRDGRYAVRPR